MSNHTEAEVQALDDLTKEIVEKFVQDVIDMQMCGTCVSMQVLTGLTATMVANGWLSPDMVMNVSAHAINLALNPDDAYPDSVDRGTIYASKVH